MKNDKIIRDQNKQNAFRAQLKQEAISLFGSEKCYASHKQYKGMTASHIKPYKICALEGDAFAAFDVNNGLLLAGTIDAYFDKFDITFTEAGAIVCSDNVPKDIQDEFSHYYLDPAVLNEKRQGYLEIHRCLFYYKNYIQGDYETPDPLESFEIPFFSCGLLIYKNKVIYFHEKYWRICPSNRVKRVFVERTQYNLGKTISNADFISKLLQEPEYRISEISTGLNCPSGTWNTDKQTIEDDHNRFKISVTNYNPINGIPRKFIEMLTQVLGNKNDNLELFRMSLKLALMGKGNDHGFFLTGNISSINIVFGILQQVVGSYLFKLTDKKGIYKGSPTEGIPNCRLLLVKLRTTLPDQLVLTAILENIFFPDTKLNIDKYVPFYICENKNCNSNNHISFDFNHYIGKESVEDIVKQEGGEILYWILSATVKKEKFVGMNSNSKTTHAMAVAEWFEQRIIVTQNYADLVSANLLFEDYQKFAMNRNYEEITQRRFFMDLAVLPIGKIRKASGIFYRGIKVRERV